MLYSPESHFPGPEGPPDDSTPVPEQRVDHFESEADKHRRLATETRDRAKTLHAQGKVDQARRLEDLAYVHENSAEVADGREALERAWLDGAWEKGYDWEEPKRLAQEVKQMQQALKQESLLGKLEEDMDWDELLAQAVKRGKIVVRRKLRNAASALAELGQWLIAKPKLSDQAATVAEFEEEAKKFGPGVNHYMAEMARRWWNEVGSRRN